jgi:hypothetical protein
MVEPFLTILVISTIIGGISTLIGAIGAYSTKKTNDKIEKRNLEIEKKERKLKNIIQREYTPNGNKVDYLKLLYLMHFHKKRSIKSTFVTIPIDQTHYYKFEVPLQKLKFLFTYRNKNYMIKLHVNESRSIIVCFSSKNTKQRFDRYLKTITMEHLHSRYVTVAEDDENSFSESSDQDF